MCRKFCFSLLGASVAAKNILILMPLKSTSWYLHSISSVCVSCGLLLFEASWVNLVFTKSSLYILKVLGWFLPVFLPNAVSRNSIKGPFQRRVQFLQWRSQKPRVQVYSHLMLRTQVSLFFFFKHIYCWTLISTNTDVSFSLLNFCNVKILGDTFFLVPTLGPWVPFSKRLKSLDNFWEF